MLVRQLHDISKGLDYIHRQGIVHGDLKAVNVFVFYTCRDTELRSKLKVLIDDGGNTVICDFGLSRIKSDVNTQSCHAGFEGIVGT